MEFRSWTGILGTTLCNKVCQWIATGRCFSSCTPVSSTNKTDHHDITEILKVSFNTMTLTNKKNCVCPYKTRTLTWISLTSRDCKYTTQGSRNIYFVFVWPSKTSFPQNIIFVEVLTLLTVRKCKNTMDL